MPTAPASPELLHPAERGGVAAVPLEGRHPVLASGCGAVSTFLAEPGTVEARPRKRHAAAARGAGVRSTYSFGGLMRIPAALAGAGVLLASGAATAEAQRTGDRPQLVFTISGGYIGEAGLWSVPSQPVFFENGTSTLAVERSISPTIAGALAVTYFPKDKIGFTGEAFFTSLGLDDGCRITAGGTPTIIEACQDIDTQAKSAASVAVSAGTIFRVASREFISPFFRASVGLLFTNQSSLLTQGLSRGYHLRWEVRDNIAGIERVSGATSQFGQVPPHETVYKHLFGVMVGLDIVLERRRGRRY